MKREIVKKIVNIWDPLGVYGLGPKDEYNKLIDEIIILFEDKNKDEDKIKSFLLDTCYNETSKNFEKVNELYDLLFLVLCK